MKTDIKEMKNTIMEKTKDGNKKWEKKKQHYKKSRKRIWKKDQNNRQKESETKLCIVIKKEQWKQEKIQNQISMEKDGDQDIGRNK